MIIYLELFIALFFLPGFFITVILGIQRFRFLLSFALSYSLVVLTLLPFEYYAQPIVRWEGCVLLEWVILAAWAVIKTFMYENSNSFRRAAACRRTIFSESRWPLTSRCPALIRRLLSPRLIVPLVLAAVICGYLAYAGPYLEIPADAWEHVRRFQWQKLTIIDKGAFLSGFPWVNFLFHPVVWSFYYNPWYFIHAWLSHVSGLPVMGFIHVLTFVNVLTFLLAIYYFGLFLFAGLRISAFKKMMMAALAALFAAVTMGNMVFAYIRYYAFAPAILNYVLFLAAMALIIAWLRSNRWLGHALWITPVLVLVTSLIHPQESLFVLFMTFALSIVETIRVFWRKFIYGNLRACPALAGVVAGVACPELASAEPLAKPWQGRRVVNSRKPNLFSTAGQFFYSSHCSAREWKPVILAAVLLLIFFAGFAVIWHFKPGAWISTNMIMPNVGIPPEPVNFIFRNLMISPPENPWLRLAAYQLFIFYQVVGCWGLFVYLLFILMLRRFVKIPYLTAGMIIVPLLTVFNPMTIDMMARMGQDPTLYRFHYMIPLPFVGGYLFVHYAGKMREWSQKMRAAPAKSVSSIWPRLSWLNFAGSILVLAGLIGFVFPINAAGIYAPYSKIYTLRKIPAGNDYRLCDDLGQIMAKYENKVILTDEWTAKYLRYYSPKNTYSHIRWLNSLNPEKEPPEPYVWEKLRNRGLIVINRRNGTPSITGRIAKHWSEDVLLKVSRSYSIEAQHYLESHPEIFRKIWAHNQIAVYATR